MKFWPYHVACMILSFLTRDGIVPPAVKEWSLNHWTIGQVPENS